MLQTNYTSQIYPISLSQYGVTRPRFIKPATDADLTKNIPLIKYGYLHIATNVLIGIVYFTTQCVVVQFDEEIKPKDHFTKL